MSQGPTLKWPQPRTFEELCGKNPLQNVILVMIMWDEDGGRKDEVLNINLFACVHDRTPVPYLWSFTYQTVRTVDG